MPDFYCKIYSMHQYDYLKCTDINYGEASNIIKQYLNIKLQNLRTILFFRIGEFYETLCEDANTLSQECGVYLTKKEVGNGKMCPMAGVPVNSADAYIQKLLSKKLRVALCDQESDEKCPDTGLIKRRIVRTFSLGTVCDGEFLDSDSNNYICAVLQKENSFGFAYCDVSTGEFFITQGGLNEILSEMTKVNPSEFLAPIKPREIKPFTVIEEEKADLDEELTLKFKPTLVSSKSFNNLLIKCQHPEYELGNRCANAILAYVLETQQEYAPKLSKVESYDIYEYLVMDENARRNLELTENLSENKKYGSLFWAIDKTKTPMGRRLLKQWINQPLRNVEKIEARQDAVEELLKKPSLLEKLKDELKGCYDIARLSTKITNNSMMPGDFLSLKDSLCNISSFANILKECKSVYINFLNERYSTLEDFAGILSRTILDEPNNALKEGGLIKEGANSNLDFMKSKMFELQKQLEEYENKEKENIKGLKVGENRIIGYFIEVPNSQLKTVPEHYRQKQSLSNCTRYTTYELQELEQKINLLARKINELEYEIYVKLREYSKELVEDIRILAHNIAGLDVLHSFARCVLEYDYIRPQIKNGPEFEIREGAHPCASLFCENFIVNDTLLEERNFILLTGSNMSGKSTYLRQNALLVILTQMGSYIPAVAANIGIIDKIFTRMGSSDDLIHNKSSFMVEMLEVANILKNATHKSLILLDEVGKNTGVEEGPAIARAVSEYIIENVHAKTIFATHYHKLADLDKKYSQAENLMMSKETQHKIKKGFLNKSYGIETAKDANLPDAVIEKAIHYMV